MVVEKKDLKFLHAFTELLKELEGIVKVDILFNKDKEEFIFTLGKIVGDLRNIGIPVRKVEKIEALSRELIQCLKD